MDTEGDGKSVLWGYPRSATAWCRWRPCWSWSRSLTRTCSRSNTLTEPTTSAHQALREVQGWLDRGYTEVVDADLSGYFDSIPHHELMKCVARRISDRHLLHLMKMWLEAPVEETDEEGRTERTTRNKDEGRGTPQGGVASPLLANLYMRRFVLGWKAEGHEQRLGRSHRQLCGRLRDLLPAGQSRRGDDGDAADDGAAAVDGEREEDAAVSRCRKRRLLSWGSRSGRKCLGRRAGAYVAPARPRRRSSRSVTKISETTSGRTTWRDEEEQVGNGSTRY